MEEGGRCAGAGQMGHDGGSSLMGEVGGRLAEKLGGCARPCKVV